MFRGLMVFAIVCLVIMYWSMSAESPSSAEHQKQRNPVTSKPTAVAPAGTSFGDRDVVGRVVAVGDLHSDLPQALKVLEMANLVDSDGKWIGGTDTLVSTGDIVDRGPDTIALYNLFTRLRGEAKEAGGSVVNVFGNHEVMNLGGDLRYVTDEDFASFGGREKRKQAWDPHTGWLGQMLVNNFNITHIQNKHTVFSHGDMHPEWAKQGIDRMNQLAMESIMTGRIRTAAIFQSEGPIWWRGLAQEEDGNSKTCEYVEAVKRALGVNRLISGHTPQYRTGKILSLCKGGYMVIDVGISRYYGAHVAALEILEHPDNTQSVYALYPTGKKKIS